MENGKIGKWELGKWENGKWELGTDMPLKFYLSVNVYVKLRFN